MIKVYQDIVQPVIRFPWEPAREHEPSRAFVSGSLQYLERAAPITGPPLTLSSWINFTDLTSVHSIISLADSSVGDQYFLLMARGNVGGDPIRFDARSVGISSADTSIGYLANTWQHVCAVAGGVDDRSVFIQGGNEGTNTTTTTPTGIDVISIARLGDSTPGAYADGRIFWPCVWNVALTNAEVSRLASGVPPWWVRPEAIVACPDLRTLYDPFMRASFKNFGSVIANPYRDWTLPDDIDILGSAVGAAVGNVPQKMYSYKRRRVA